MANQLKLTIEDNEVLTGSRINVIDTTNQLATFSGNSYTATQDCALVTNDCSVIYIDGVKVKEHHSVSDIQLVYLKKGQVMTSGTYKNGGYIYGIKR